MINVLIPSCGKSKLYENSYYPKNVIEISGKPMIQHVVENYADINDKKFTFVFLQDECDKFHTDHITSILTNETSNVIKLKNSTGGALCTSLMAIDYINNDDELIIANSDQIIMEDINEVINEFRKKKVDCGVITFNSVHPRWSYVRLAGENVVETAEKRPLSHHAIAGFYYFAKGKQFVKAAKQAIKKGEMYDNAYYISSAINEMILQNRLIGYYEIENSKYFSFYTPDKINSYVKEQH